MFSLFDALVAGSASDSGARGSYLVAMATAICPASNPARSLNRGQPECSTPIYSLKSHHLASVPPTREQIN